MTNAREYAEANNNNIIMQGSISLYTGCMFAGKTTKLLESITAAKESGCEGGGIIVKWGDDKRYDAVRISTHDRKTSDAYKTLAVNRLEDVRDHLFHKNIDHVFIDEGQFYPDLCKTVKELEDAGKQVYIAALDLDCMKKPWEQVAALRKSLPTENVWDLKANCTNCGALGVAEYTYKTASVSQIQQQRVQVGGSDLYIAVCSECYEIRAREAQAPVAANAAAVAHGCLAAPLHALKTSLHKLRNQISNSFSHWWFFRNH